MTIDTLKVAKAMEKAGMPQPQSEALAIVLRDEVTSDLVTNADLGAAVDRLETEIAHRTDRLEAELRHQTGRLETKIDEGLRRVDVQLTMIKWLLAFMVAALSGIFWALLRLR